MSNRVFQWLGVGASIACGVVVSAAQGSTAARQNGAGAPPPPVSVRANPGDPAASTLPADYVIGPEDVLSIVVWRDKDLSTKAVVRPDGKISLPLINDVQAAGLTPEQLRANITTALANGFTTDPVVGIVVEQINSRKVFIVGEVNKQGGYPLHGNMTVMQLISVAGGLTDFADKKNIIIMRAETRPDGQPWTIRFNYDEVTKRRNPKQNIELKPGDTVIVR